MDWREERLNYIKSEKFNGKGPCLIPKPGKQVPSCHENYFCECDVCDAYQEGATRGLLIAAEIIDYYKSLSGGVPAYYATLRDVEVSCAASRLRISRGEYQNSVSTCFEPDALQASDVNVSHEA